MQLNKIRSKGYGTRDGEIDLYISKKRAGSIRLKLRREFRNCTIGIFRIYENCGINNFLL
jgi:hypothetical protein